MPWVCTHKGSVELMAPWVEKGGENTRIGTWCGKNSGQNAPQQSEREDKIALHTWSYAGCRDGEYSRLFGFIIQCFRGVNVEYRTYRWCHFFVN